MDFPADADAAADARADRDQQEVVRLPSGARINLAVKGAVGVVAQICGDAQPAGKRLRQRIIGQRQVGRADKDAARLVHRSRHTDADGRDSGARKLPPAGVRQRVQNRVRAAGGVGGKRFVKENLSGIVHQAGLDGGSAQIDA